MTKSSFKTTTLIAAIGMSVYALSAIIWHVGHPFALAPAQFIMFRGVLGVLNIGILLISMGFACFALCKYRPTKNVSRNFRRLTILLSILLTFTMLTSMFPIMLIRINGACFCYPEFWWRAVLMISGAVWLFGLSRQEATEPSPRAFEIATICGMVILALPVLLGLISGASYVCADKLLFLRSTCVSTWVRYIVPTIILCWYSVALHKSFKINKKTIRALKSIIIFAFSAVLTIMFASCNNKSPLSPLKQRFVVWSCVDEDVQQIVMEEVKTRRNINQADWACALVLNELGEGIAGYEMYDSTTTHYHLTDKQAIGTLFMPFSLLMTSATSFVDSSLTFPVHKEGWRPYEGKKIFDSHPRDTILRVRDIIATSSYQGAGRALMASIWLKRNGVKNFKHYLNKLGCDSNQFCQWSEFASITGTDVITTPEHIAWLYHCLAHGLFPKEWRVESSGVLEGLHDCVWNNDLGTASVTKCGDVVIYDRAQSDKVAIMGKTGTVTIDKDPHKHVISFVGIFPEDNPQYTCLVMFGNPKGTYSAGVDCGGTVRRIAERIMTK